MELNAKKCEYMVISTKNNKKHLTNMQIKLNNSTLKRVNCIKILGVFIDEDLNFNTHCNAVIKKCNGALWSLKPLKHVLSIKNKTNVIQALVLSLTNYATPIWLISMKNLNLIDKLIKTCARFIFNKSKYDSISDILNVDLDWLNAKNLCLFEMAKLSYRMMNNTGPELFHNYLELQQTNERTTRNQSYISLNISHGWGAKSFKTRASNAWVKLPELIQINSNIFSLMTFKKLVKNHFINLQRTDRMREIFELIDDYEADLLQIL